MSIQFDCMIGIYKRRLMFVFVFLLSYFMSFSQNKPDSFFNISWDTSITTLKSLLTQNAPQLLYIKTSKELDVNNKAERHIQIEQYISSKVYLVYFNNSFFDTTTNIVAWAKVATKNKINAQLYNNITQFNTAPINVLVKFVRSIDINTIEDLLSKGNIFLTKRQPWAAQNVYEITIPINEIPHLTSISQVVYVNPVLVDEAFNNKCRAMTGAYVANAPLAIGGYNLHGNGVTIGIGDNTNPQTHVDLEENIMMLNPEINTAHGYHTMGTITGDGIKDERYKGFAPKARAISQFFSAIITEAPSLFQEDSMLITNNSYGVLLGDCSYAGTYDLYAQMVDEQMNNYPKLLHIFAAANDGALTCTPFPLGYATIAGAYQPAKNVLTVGSARKYYSAILSDFSSRGPVKDGRLKPEMLAIGEDVTSCGFNDEYITGSGTSMAAPNVTGAAILILQRFRQLNGGIDPDAALLKLLLMNGATDVLNPGPDYLSGFGLMNIVHSLIMLDSNRYFSGTISEGQTQNFSFAIPSNCAKVKVMLYWNDPAGMPETQHELVNDLDLKVIDAGGNTLLPLILNPTPANVSDNAIHGEDHLNNVEQVAITNPTAGNYTISVKGYNIATSNQKYFVAYDVEQVGVQIQFPFGGEGLVAGDTVNVYWEASDNSNDFTVQYSSDNGINWHTIHNDIPANIKAMMWAIPDSLASTTCKIKIIRNNTNQQSISNAFTVLHRPILQLYPEEQQCPGSIKVHWDNINGTEAYTLYKKQSDSMMAVAILSNTDTQYVFTGLDQNTKQWVAVAPMLNGKTGMRSIAIARTPNTGECQGYNTGDLSLNEIVSPKSGRIYTSSNLSAPQILKVIVGNNNGNAANHYRVAYQLNNNNWQHQDFITPISVAGNTVVTLDSVPMDLSQTGNYTLTTYVQNLTQNDTINSNDTLVTVIKNIPNDTLNIDTGYYDGFESIDIPNTQQNIFGIQGAHHWDFTASKPQGQIRSIITHEITISGIHSLSMDNAINMKDSISECSFNSLIGTFNLSNYSLSNKEIRCEFDYRLHGIPKFIDTGNSMWMRGVDTSSWIQVFSYDTNNIGMVHNSGSISINDILATTNQSLSSSTQIKIEQYDTSLISTADFGNGLTIDNFKLYAVSNDVQLIKIDSLPPLNCSLTDNVTLTVTVRNGVLQDLYDIPISYQLDSSLIIQDTIPFIASKDTVHFSFNQTMNLSDVTKHTISVWVHLANDSYSNNDSIIHYVLYNQPIISQYPYLQNFETSDSGYFTEGKNNTWQYGQPQSPIIKYAASGIKAWKTNLTGSYNNNEKSYLYTPCFNIGSLQNPTLSFSLAYNIEPRTQDQLFDHAYIEYSNNGENWYRLGAIDEGTNWYNDSANVWQGNASYWHVATIALPKTADIIMLRYVFISDAGATYDGIAIDDIHLYDLQYPIEDNSTNYSMTLLQNDSSMFINDGKISASIHNIGNSLGNVLLANYKHLDYINADSMQYFLPRSFTIKPKYNSGTNTQVKLFVLDSDMDKIRNDTQCISCGYTKEVYRLGITKYSSKNKNEENDSMKDNIGGTYQYIPFQQIQWVPYGKGYYANFQVTSFSEFWFNDGGITHQMPLNKLPLIFNAAHLGDKLVQLKWTSYIDTSINQYVLQRSTDSIHFTDIVSVQAIQMNAQQNYEAIDTPILTSPNVYYRLYYQSKSNTQEWRYSITRAIDWKQQPYVVIYPNPVHNGIMNISWIKSNTAPINWHIYNIAGKEIAAGETTNNVYYGTASINIGSLGIANGLLIVIIQSGSDTWNFKLVYQQN